MPARAPAGSPPLEIDGRLAGLIGAVCAVPLVMVVVEVVAVLVVVELLAAAVAVAVKATTCSAAGANRRPAPTLGVGKWLAGEPTEADWSTFPVVELSP
jgi:hypothetical protein